ncbi:MAG: hypothetical protein LYZ69_08985 [Nitrososphaerales archaeon]|nr:hypothetical protein [Nitrososphaerales archaeon]
MEPHAVVEELKSVGLTGYEAKCYASLVKLGPSDPRRVAEDASLPHPNAYEALKRLEAKGWVELVRRRPATYRARKPGSVKSMVASKMDEAFDALDRVYRSEPAEEAELVYTLRGRDRVLSKIYELVAGARESVVLVTPTLGLNDERLLNLLGLAVKRRLKVRCIGDGGASGILPPGVKLRKGNLVAVDLLVDDKMALISLPDYSACGWIDSPQVASHFKQFLELLWNSSSPA